MEKNDKRYENGKIYKIVCDTTGQVYIGSTITKRLCDRLAKHKSEYNNYIIGNRKYKPSNFDILKNNNYKIVLLENYSCKSKDELFSKEREYIDKIECININRPTITEEERHQTNLKKDRLYKERNRQKLRDYKREVDKIKIICECGCESTKGHLSRHKKSKKHLSLIENKINC